MQKKLFIIEDDALLNDGLNALLKKHGYLTVQAYSVQGASEMLNETIDLAIVDIGLPDGTGLDFSRKIKSLNVPFLFFTARDDEEQMVKAFDIGADDYLVKPFSLTVLLKHIEAVLRRTEKSKNAVFSYKGLTIDFSKKQVKCDNKMVHLTAKEYKILELLVKNQNKIITKTIILEKVWDQYGLFVEENSFHVTLNRLRKKIEPDSRKPIYIKNVFGLGYIFGDETC